MDCLHLLIAVQIFLVAVCLYCYIVSRLVLLLLPFISLSIQMADHFWDKVTAPLNAF
jgi:uncharacterized membrane protein